MNNSGFVITHQDDKVGLLSADGRWGLVDEHGAEVTPFDYSDIHAHWRNGYKAIKTDGTCGFLLEDGTFKPTGKKSQNKSINTHQVPQGASSKTRRCDDP